MFSDEWRGVENNLRRKNSVEMSTNPCTYSVPHFTVTDKPSVSARGDAHAPYRCSSAHGDYSRLGSQACR